MRLKRLMLQGFKSFKDKTVVHFHDGITGIVGPNGCGKSNIVDALFWVMGEMSAKHLRGSSMKDVIFSGSAKHGPASFAEVTLILENTFQKLINIAGNQTRPSEISLTRKLYRDGESEYRINGEPARLKDIQEVFMDTGAGAKSYSIIAQGEIDRLVRAKPEERRVMLEEVAGITKFKMRKKESQKKIETTHANLARIQDLNQEIYKQMKSLEHQAQKAERAKVLKEKIQKWDLVVEGHRELEFLKEWEIAQRNLNESKQSIEENLMEKNQLDLRAEKLLLEKKEIEEVVNEKQKRYLEMSKNLAGREEKLRNIKGMIIRSEQDLLASQQKKIKLQEETDHSVQQLKESQQELEQIEAQGKTSESLDELRDNLNIHHQAFQDQAAQKKAFIAEKEKLDKEIFQSDQKLNELKRQRQELEHNLDLLHMELEHIEKENAKELHQYSKLNKDQNHVEEKTKLSKEKFEQSKTEFSEFEQQMTFLVKERNALKLKVDLAQAEIANYLRAKEMQLQIPAELKEHLDHHSYESFKWIQDTFTVEKEEASLIEKILSPLMGTLVSTGNEEENTHFLNWWKNKQVNTKWVFSTSNPSANEFPIDLKLISEKYGVNITSPLNKITFVSDIWKKILSPYFMSIAIMDEFHLDKASQLLTEYPFTAVVSRDGHWLLDQRMQLMQMSHSTNVANKMMGIVELSSHIKDLELKVEQLNKQIDLLHQQAADCEVNKKNKEEEVKVNQKDYFDCQSKFDLLINQLSTYEQIKASAEKKFNHLFEKKKLLAEKRFRIIEELESVENVFNQLIISRQQFESKEKLVFESFEVQQNQYQALKEALQKSEWEEKTYQSRKDSVQSKVRLFQDACAKNTAALKELEASIAHIATELNSMQTSKVELDETNGQLATELSTFEAAYKSDQDQLKAVVSGLNLIDNQLKKISSSIQQCEKECIRLESRMKQLSDEEIFTVRDLFERYQVNMRMSAAKTLEFNVGVLSGLAPLDFIPEGVVLADYLLVRKYGADLKEAAIKLKNYKQELARLGDIHYGAVDEFELQKKRYDFLQNQEQELKKSLEDLTRAIAHIDEKSKVRFKEAYDEVNFRFEKVFPIIFGGGSAKLNIVGHIDDPECGIDIMAQPPGKKMQNVNLMSGGEKALTAVSLIFSIFLVKPSPFCLLDEVDAPLDDANVGRFNDLLREMSSETQFILITHNKKTMELNNHLYGVTMQEPGISTAVSVQIQ